MVKEQSAAAKAGSIVSQLVREDKEFFNQMERLFKPHEWAE